MCDWVVGHGETNAPQMFYILEGSAHEPVLTGPPDGKASRRTATTTTTMALRIFSVILLREIRWPVAGREHERQQKNTLAEEAVYWNPTGPTGQKEPGRNTRTTRWANKNRTQPSYT